MTVKELIEVLQAFPPEMNVEVKVPDCECSSAWDMELEGAEVRGNKYRRVILA